MHPQTPDRVHLPPLLATSRCARCGRAYHKTARGPNTPYSGHDETVIRELAAQGAYAFEIARRLGGGRSPQNVREKARRLGVVITWAPPGPRAVRGQSSVARKPRARWENNTDK